MSGNQETLGPFLVDHFIMRQAAVLFAQAAIMLAVSSYNSDVGLHGPCFGQQTSRTPCGATVSQGGARRKLPTSSSPCLWQALGAWCSAHFTWQQKMAVAIAAIGGAHRCAAKRR